MLKINFIPQTLYFGESGEDYGQTAGGIILFYLLWQKRRRGWYNGFPLDKLLIDLCGDDSDSQVNWFKTHIRKINRDAGLPVVKAGSLFVLFESDMEIQSDINTLVQRKQLLDLHLIGTEEYMLHSRFVHDTLPATILPYIQLPWAEIARREFNDFQIDLFLRQAEHYIKTTQVNSALQLYRSILEIDPLCERAIRMLMVLYETIWGIPKAMELYTQFCQRLDDACSVAPSDQTIAVFTQLMKDPAILRFSNLISR